MFDGILGVAKNVGGWLYENSTEAAYRVGNAFSRWIKNDDIENQIKKMYSQPEINNYLISDFCIKSVGLFEVVSWLGSKALSQQSEKRVGLNEPVEGMKEVIKEFDAQSEKLEKALDKEIKSIEKQKLLDDLSLQRAEVKSIGNWHDKIQSRTKARTEARLARRSSKMG